MPLAINTVDGCGLSNEERCEFLPKKTKHKCSKTTKAKAYLALVQLVLEYSSTVWDPHLIKNINEIEKVQRCAAWWVMSDYIVRAVLHLCWMNYSGPL